MNSLNIISARVVSPTSSSSAPSRSNSLSHVDFASSSSSSSPANPPEAHAPIADASAASASASTFAASAAAAAATTHDIPPVSTHQSCEYPFGDGSSMDYSRDIDEKTPLLEKSGGATADADVRSWSWHVVPARMANTIIISVRWVLSTIAAPGVYLIACFYDEQGNFAPFRQLGRLYGNYYGGDARKLAVDYHESVAMNEKGGGHARRASRSLGKFDRRRLSSGSTSSGLTSESESDMGTMSRGSRRGSTSRHTRSKSLQPDEESGPTRRSIRIKVNEENLRKHKKTQSMSAKNSGGGGGGSLAPPELSAQIKSPTSPVAALTRYPKTPAPPRPLIPRRQPSYVPYEQPVDPKHMKTLILDLDETLIHSMSKGGRMGSGHMVEVRLNTTYVASGGTQALGPQHPILYYVHKRPHCDEFLRKVCKWFNLVVFTASVQEYADPVIDWLESERKFFAARYYRQHCTFRHGAFIKDLSSVEPDLSKVMILDNSPLSYMFHQDNAIPIQGWISDPTDNDLLHLVPLLEGLQYVTDVRALLALRGGEDGQHSI